MNFPIIDTHTHGYFSHYDTWRDAMLANARRAGVIAQIQIGCDEPSSLAAVELAEKHDDIYATIGLHPCDVAPLVEGKFSDHRIAGFENYERRAHTIPEYLEWLDDLYQKISAENSGKIVGFGETGFDRYHDTRDVLVEWQRESFLGHLRLCQKYNLPVVIHTRNSTRELLDTLEQNSAEFFGSDTPVRGVVHCFCENVEVASVLTEKYGLYLGIGGVATYTNTADLSEAIQRTDWKYLLTETDAPFLPPARFRKEQSKTNDPSSLPEIVEKIALLKGESVEKSPSTNSEQAAEILVDNAKRLFGI